MVNSLCLTQYFIQIAHEIAPWKLSEPRQHLTELGCLASTQHQVIWIMQYQVSWRKQTCLFYRLLHLRWLLILICLCVYNFIIWILRSVILIPRRFYHVSDLFEYAAPKCWYVTVLGISACTPSYLFDLWMREPASGNFFTNKRSLLKLEEYDPFDV